MISQTSEAALETHIENTRQGRLLHWKFLGQLGKRE